MLRDRQAHSNVTQLTRLHKAPRNSQEESYQNHQRCQGAHSLWWNSPSVDLSRPEGRSSEECPQAVNRPRHSVSKREATNKALIDTLFRRTPSIYALFNASNAIHEIGYLLAAGHFVRCFHSSHQSNNNADKRKTIAYLNTYTKGHKIKHSSINK